MIAMLRIGCLAVLAMAAVSLSAMAQEPPPAGASPRIDAIHKAGILRVGVLAKLPGVTNSGATAPVEEVLARRADAAPINRVPWVGMNKKVKGLAVLPSADNCQGSMEKAAPVGIGIDKNQPAYRDWLRAVAKAWKAKLDAEERKIVDTL